MSSFRLSFSLLVFLSLLFLLNSPPPPPSLKKEQSLPLEANKPMVVQKMEHIKQPPFAYIILDPGHGGKEDGAKGWTTKVKEKDINMNIALFTQKWLSQNGVNAYLTRIGDYMLDSTDVKKDLLRRARFGDNPHLKASLFISIHIDQFNEQVHGTKVYFSSKNAFSKDSETLARQVHDHLVEQIQSKPLDVHDNDFIVLEHNALPAVLVEVGHLSHPDEEKLLISTEYQELAAIGIGKGILAYFTHHLDH